MKYLSEMNTPYRPWVAESLLKDTVHNEKPTIWNIIWIKEEF